MSKETRLIVYALLPALLLCLSDVSSHAETSIPKGFVYLRDVDKTITQDIRYATSNNFYGSQVPGYMAGECVLTKEAAERLAKAQVLLLKEGLSLIVWDCYRPLGAVKAFVSWSKEGTSGWTGSAFFPRVSKDQLFKQGYIAEVSSHSRGSTVDLGLMRDGHKIPAISFKDSQRSCIEHSAQQRDEGTLDFGTSFDCFDRASGSSADAISHEAKNNRSHLRQVMAEVGFKPYQREWWHFTLVDEPYKTKAFDFDIIQKK